MMKLKVRVKGIMIDLIENTNASKMPLPLIVFLESLMRPKAYVPDNFLTEFELNRIHTDSYGAIVRLEPDQIKMISCMYLLGKVLIAKILLNPNKAGF
jgi:hypothetical protein